ncbi:DedA family protein [Phenylobacterium sp.]|jgi:membrane protein DedA with SNARE-associated domain|uniref:DedA family protein n=1 Tax=Phenylobacterium sp. TaxID=1871053 RepID=UPI002E37A344|nr:DedA family protein [Phenylobacterium sp.]HEX2559669.1 DedA family protein [Phenylobacterium sp.]
MVDWLIYIVTVGGLFAVAALMFAENLFPPIPSELIMPLAGFLAAQGHLDFAGVVLAGTAGAVAGAALWYQIGRAFGERRLKRWAGLHGRWMTVTPADVDKAMAFFRRYGPAAMFFGRLAPGVRTLISIPAGLAAMPKAAFLIFTTAGAALWTLLLAAAGYQLGEHYEKVAGWVDPVANGVVVFVVLVYLYRLVTFRPHRAAD